MTILLSLALLGAPSFAAPCSETAAVRVDSAKGLLREAHDAPAVDKAALVERARILLERTLDDDPSCRRAEKLKDHADGLAEDVQALSTAAAREGVLARAAETLDVLEAEGVEDPLDVEALRFQLAALDEVMPDDDRVAALSQRAAALGGER